MNDLRREAATRRDLFLLPKGTADPVEEVRLDADDPDGLVRAARTHLAAHAE